jgi:hypothetical protein
MAAAPLCCHSELDPNQHGSERIGRHAEMDFTKRR